MKISYPSILKLKSYQVLPDFDEHSTSKIFDIDVHQPLTYGKTIFFITYKIKRNQKDFFLRQGSEIKCEILDSRGKNIYTDFIPFKKVGGTGIGYIRIDDSLLERTDGWLTQDGQGEIILMGQLAGDSIPPEWRDTYNCRFTYPIKIRKELPNTSPLFFNTSGSLDLPRIDVYETLESDIDTQIYPDETYKRSFANIVFDNLHTIGGTTKFSEINYNPVSASTDDDTILDTIPISSSEMLLGRIANVGMTSLTDTASKFTNNTPTFPDAGVHSHSYGDTLLTYPQYGNEIQRFSGFTQNWNTAGTNLNGVRRYPLGDSTINHKYNEDIKIFRYAYEDEEYVLNFIGSGSFNIVIAESPHQTDLTSSFLPGRSTLDENSNYDDHLVHTYDTLTDYGTGNLNVIYSQSIIDWDPYTASKWISDNTEVDPSNIVSSSDGAIIKDTFTVSKGNFAAIHIMSSPEIGTSWTSSIDLVSIRPKENSGSNAPFYYHKVQMPPRRRNEVINFNSKFLNANMEIAQDLNFSDTNLIVSASSFFTGSPVIIEGDDGIFGGALRSRGYRGYRNASNSDGGAGFILYSGSIDTSGDFGSDGEYTGGVGFELHGGHNRDALKFSTETGELEITGSVLIEGVMTASSGEIGGWNIGESSLFHSSSTNQMILSGSKGTIDMFSGSNAFPSLQISSDINEDSGDALATPGLFVQDGVIFLKRTSGSMPQGSKSGVTPFEQIGTRIKPGFFHIHNSGSNSDEYQRLGNDGSVLGIHSVNQHTSGTAFGDDTNIIKIKSYQFQNTTDNAEHVLINAYGMVQSGTLYNIRVHNEGQRDAEDGHYLFYGQGENADYGNNFHFYIKNSTFKMATSNDTFHEILPTSRSLTHVGGDYLYNYPANHSVLQQATSSANDGYAGGSNTKGNMPGIVAAAYSAPIGVSQTMGRDSSPFFTGLIRSATKLEPSIYVSASSNVGIRTFFPDKELTISGSVSASGDISSSGFFTPLGVTSSIHAVTASHALNGGGGGGTPGGSDTQVQFNDGGSFEGDAGFTYDKDTNSITAINHITASGNISASVDNYQRVIYNSAGAVFNNDGGNATVQIKGGTDDYLITTNVSGNDKVGIGQLPVTGKSKLQITGDVSTTSHITASGKISSSNVIQGKTFTNVSGTNNFGGSNLFGFTDASDSTHQFSGSLRVVGSITASGDISASGNVIANSLNSDSINAIGSSITVGHPTRFAASVTASNNISASNHIFAQTGSFTGGIIADSHISSSGRIYGKQRETTFHQYNNDTSLSALFIPAPGGYIVESTAVNYYRQWVAPYDGELIKVIINFENDPGTVRLYLYLNGSATHRKSVSSTSTAAGINTFDMTSTDVGARSTFDEGDILSFTIQCYGAGPGDVNVTMVWEYNMFVDI